MSKRTFVLMLFVCSLALPALAVEKGQIGLALSTGAPPTLGALWHVSNRVALDPAVGFSVRSTDDFCTDGDSCGPTPGPYHTLYGGLGLRYYVAPGRTVSPYLRTRLTYSLTSGDDHTLTWTVAAAGLHYSPSKHFSVFGDVGLSAAGSWQHLSEVNDGQVSVGHSRTWTVGTFTSSIGAVLYLN
jgi:hypothetical protein